MANYLMKGYLIVAACSGVLGIIAGILVMQQRPLPEGHPFGRKLLQKNLVRGFTTLLWVGFTFELYLRGIVGSWGVLLLMGVLTIATEYVLLNLIKAGVVQR